MENKETIINDVDVSECEYCLKMIKHRCTIQQDVYKCLCEENPNCHYKQRKRKEQECEKLKKELIKEFYTYNPNGSIWEFNEWKEKVNLEDKAHNPHRYQVTVRKPPRQKAKKF